MDGDVLKLIGVLLSILAASVGLNTKQWLAQRKSSGQPALSLGQPSTVAEKLDAVFSALRPIVLSDDSRAYELRGVRELRVQMSELTTAVSTLSSAVTKQTSSQDRLADLIEQDRKAQEKAFRPLTETIEELRSTVLDALKPIGG
jgi:hypothetical protein